MRLLSDWKRVVRRAWSFRLMVLAAGLSGVEVALPIMGSGLPRGLFATLSFVVTVSAMVARLLAQREPAAPSASEPPAGQQSGRASPKVVGGAAVASAAVAAFLMLWEGYREDVYLDVVDVPTVGVGHTGADVQMGEHWTRERIAEALRRDAGLAAEAVARCIRRPLTQGQRDAFTSFAFNVGDTAFCQSTLVVRANAGDLPGACAQLRRWVRAGGRVVRGLVNRREAEYAMCVTP